METPGRPVTLNGVVADMMPMTFTVWPSIRHSPCPPRLIDVVRWRRGGQREPEPGHVANFILAAVGRRLHESRLHLEDMQTGENIKAKIPVQRREAHTSDG